VFDQRRSVNPLLDFFLFFFNFNAERFQKFQILIADFEFRIGAKRGDERGLSLPGTPCLLTPMVASRTRKMS